MCSSPGLTPLPSACLYANLADEGDGLLRSNMFCQDECLNLVDKCLDLSNYPSLRDQVILGRRVHVLNLITSRFNPYHLTFPHITLHTLLSRPRLCVTRSQPLMRPKLDASKPASTRQGSVPQIASLQ